MVLWIAIGITLGYLVSFGVACGIYTKCFDWDDLDESPKTFFASAFWFVVLPALLACKAVTTMPDAISRQIAARHTRKREIQQRKFDRGKLPESIESVSEYRQVKLLVERYEKDLPVCER